MDELDYWQERGLREQVAESDEWRARAEAAEAEVARLTAESNELQTLLDGAEAERDEWMETAETTESELCQFMDDLIAVVGEQVIVGDEVKFSAIVTAVAALRAQLAAAEAERDDANREAATDQRHAMEFGAENIRLRDQLAAALGAKIEVVPAPMRLRDDETPETTEERVRELENALDDAQLLADERGEELAAGEGWRPVSEPPSPGIDVELIVRAEFKPNGNFNIVLPALKWRPAPPQE